MIFPSRIAAVLCLIFVAGCATLPSPPPPSPTAAVAVKPGIDNLIADDFRPVAGKRVALLTNSAGRTSGLRTTFEVFRTTNFCRLTTVLTPEHGYDAAVPAGSAVQNDTISGIPFISLYGKFRRPTREMLAMCDIVVADIQDIGIRSYTFVSSLRNVMDACAEYGKPIIVLDRPNPLGGEITDGAPADTAALSFVASLPVPYLHGCTVGELARMMNDQGWLPSKRKATLTVVPMTGWKRAMTWEETGLAWIPTSPNVPSPETIRTMAMTGLLGEAGGVSIGIGTALPFRYIGRPDSIAAQIMTALATMELPADALPVRFRPEFGAFDKQLCSGVFLVPKNGQQRFFSGGIAILAALHGIIPSIREQCKKNDSMLSKVLSNPSLSAALARDKGLPLRSLVDIATKGEDEFRRLRLRYLLYE